MIGEREIEMILGITPISNVNYGIKNLKNDKDTNSEVVQNTQAPSFRSTKTIRNTMMALTAMGALFFSACKDLDSKREYPQKISIESPMDKCIGIIPNTFSLNNPSETELNDGTKILKKNNYIITETPNARIITRNLDCLDGCEETTYFKNGDYSYEYIGCAIVNRNNSDDCVIERKYEYYNKDGELLYWEDKTIDNSVSSPVDGTVQFKEDKEYKGCKRIKEYDDYGNITADYFKSKSGIITDASILDRM